MPDDAIEFDEDDGSYTVDASFDARDGVAETVAMSVAAIRDCEPTALAPLAKVVDPDALNDLFVGVDGDDVRVSFEYAGFEVTVAADGEITLVPT